MRQLDHGSVCSQRMNESIDSNLLQLQSRSRYEAVGFDMFSTLVQVLARSFTLDRCQRERDLGDEDPCKINCGEIGHRLGFNHIR